MAYENGNNAFDYCPGIFDKYKDDRMIFSKAMQVIELYKGRADYPYCVEEMCQAVSLILGGPFDSFFFHGYVYGVANDQIVWNAKNVDGLYGTVNMVEELTSEEAESLVRQFKNEIQSFTLATSSLYHDIIENDYSRMGIKSIAYSKGDRGTKSVRIIRGDNSSLDFSLNKREVDFMIEQLSKIFSDEE